MSLRTYKCQKGCCTIQIFDYKYKPIYRTGNFMKAGVFIYDPSEDRVLLVQSRGLLWGCPKGSIETSKNETTLECAVRETKEETGIDVNPEKFTRVANIKNRAFYYYTEMKSNNVFVQREHSDNDANGITWIKTDCLNDFIKSGFISLNNHAKLVFKKFLDKTFVN